jgi:hypothetical protein
MSSKCGSKKVGLSQIGLKKRTKEPTKKNKLIKSLLNNSLNMALKEVQPIHSQLNNLNMDTLM